MKPKITYDKKANIISIRFGKKRSIDSDIKGNIVIDYDKSGEIVGIDIMGVSLEEFVSKVPHLKIEEFAAV